MGPNFKRLVIHKVSLDAIPVGGNIGDGIKFLSDPKGMKESFANAEKWVREAIDILKSADAITNYYGNDDEIIAGQILARIDAKQQHNRRKAKESTQ